MYPLLFAPIVKSKVWGSETWSLSGYGDEQSLVVNGYLRDNTLGELVETYMDELVGESVYRRYGNVFPLLFKFIDAKDDLSVQVHPDDDAASKVGQMGKTEMWYITHADSDASIVLGFSQATSREVVRRSLSENTIMELLQVVPVKQGDVAYIPAGTVHALRRGTQVAEIQETSDLTYRLYDYQRPGLDGQLRPLHIEESLSVLKYDGLKTPLTVYARGVSDVELVRDVHFVTRLLRVNGVMERDYARIDSFVVYMCTEGEVRIQCPDEDCEELVVGAGQTVLIPAAIEDVCLISTQLTTLLEVYME